MRVFRGVVLTLLLLPFGGMLAGCDTLENFQLFDNKKKLSGLREPVFPNGVPGVTQGIPPELVKGYQEPQATVDPAAAAAQATAEKIEPKPEPKPKPKPKPRKVAQPAAAQQPQQPQQPQQAWPNQPPQQPQQAQAPWPGQQQPQQAPGWPTAR
jgi:outer membrane biosynthesis protein TonB